jgi:hypothetical protein
MDLLAGMWGELSRYTLHVDPLSSGNARFSGPSRGITTTDDAAIAEQEKM